MAINKMVRKLKGSVLPTPKPPIPRRGIVNKLKMQPSPGRSVPKTGPKPKPTAKDALMQLKAGNKDKANEILRNVAGLPPINKTR